MKSCFYIMLFFLFFCFAHFSFARVTGDVDNDGTVGIKEAVYALQSIAGIKTATASPNEYSIVSGYAETVPAELEKNIMTVPSGYVFILTDIVASHANDIHSFEIYENNNLKFKVKFSFVLSYPSNTFDYSAKSLSLNSGIPFESGSEISIKSVSGYGPVIFSGFLMEK